MGAETFRLEEDLVAVAPRKPHDLVFDRRAIPRTDAFDRARIHRRTVEPGTDDLVGARVGMRDPAGNLPRMRSRLAHEREHGRRIVARLFGQYGEIDRAAVQTGWRPGLEPPGGQLHFPQPGA